MEGSSPSIWAMGCSLYFGYPQAHEDDAERAVEAGLALVEAVPKLDTVAGVPLSARVGIATGLVVVGDLIGTGAARERAVVGETPNLAARLQAIAGPNTVVIADGTRRLIGDLFELEDLGPQELKGIAEPAPCLAVLRTSAMESRFEALHAAASPRWSAARRRSNCCCAAGEVEERRRAGGSVSGEPGIGKSRLTAALLERLADEPHMRLRYFCSPQHTDSALYPVIGQMERAAGFRARRCAEGEARQARSAAGADLDLSRGRGAVRRAAVVADDGRYPRCSSHRRSAGRADVCRRSSGKWRRWRGQLRC